MLAKFQSIRDGYLRHITAAKHLIKLHDSHTIPTQSGPYRADRKAREFDNAKREIMLKQREN